MKKLAEGRCEIFTTKQDAIDKFMQLQGPCRDRINNREDRLTFTCAKSGDIVITNPPTRYVSRHNSTNLYAEVLQENGKTYVTYYTGFSTANYVLKILSVILDIAILVLACVWIRHVWSVALFLMALVFLVFRITNDIHERQNAPKDSEIMVNELMKKIDAVNQWDK